MTRVRLRRSVWALSWLACGAILAGVAVEASRAISEADPSRTPAGVVTAQIAASLSILVALPLLFAGAALAVCGALPLIPVAEGAYAFATLATLDAYYWPDHQRYIDTMSAGAIAVVAALCVGVGVLTWRWRMAGAVANVLLVLVLFAVVIGHGTH